MESFVAVKEQGAATKFMRDALRWKTWGRLLADEVGNRSGVILSSATAAPVADFTHSVAHVVEPDRRAQGALRSGGMDALVERLCSAGGWLIAEHSLASPGDPFLRLVEDYVCVEDNVLFVVEAGPSTRGKVVEALRCSRSASVHVGALVSQRVAPEKLGDEGTLVECARRASMVFVMAYDGEGYLLWERERAGR